MRINNITQQNIEQFKSIQAKRSESAESDAQKTAANDNINLSGETLAMKGIADRIKSDEEVRPIVIKRYADFVDKPLSVADQNIASALRRSMMT